ncbi:MAG: T9SS type A sorting domain-containing protein, partial [Paludibacteraceae bacterium]|nr:T9SS type A sorting domain-containing protein [Paludibacteraceae bacterium]
GKAYGATAANTPLTGAGEYGIMSIDDSNDLKFAVSLASETTFDVTVNATTGKMTVADKQGMALENVIVDGAVEVYDIQGRYVAASTADLPAGMYIVRTVSGSSKIVVY